MSDVLGFIPFLEAIKKQSLAVPAISFCSDDTYPLLFFTRMIECCNQKYGQSIVSIDNNGISKQQLLGQLETSFLGTTSTYWLKNFAGSSSREKTFWIDYCSRYKGPHTLWFFAREETDHALSITLPKLISAHEYTVLAQWFGITPTPYYAQFTKKLFAHRSSGITLDDACLMIEYMQLIGTDHDHFFKDVLHRIIPSEGSLFTLSSAFMAKKTTQFYAQWHQLASLYSEQFWCSFFSDLVWRGAEYVRLAKKNDMIGARKIAYRLPFSFIKSDWRKLTNRELVAAHSFIFDADFRFKNSGGYAAFDLFFSSFFLGSFDKTR